MLKPIFLFLILITGAYCYKASATGTIGITILPKVNISKYLDSSNANQTWNNTDRFNVSAYNATKKNYTFYENLNITLTEKSRNESECQTQKTKDWDYYRFSLYYMGFDVSGQSKDFIDMIINNMGNESYYHRCLRGL